MRTSTTFAHFTSDCRHARKKEILETASDTSSRLSRDRRPPEIVAPVSPEGEAERGQHQPESQENMGSFTAQLVDLSSVTMTDDAPKVPSYADKVATLDTILERLHNSETPIDELAEDVQEVA